uniref:MAM domain-containing protein n=1 Tax=Elaeophora elaphi TaxID=1147741 RepID=A0A0R3RKF0_9BILA
MLKNYFRTLEAPWHRLEGNIAIDDEGEGLAKSGFFSTPIEAFFEMDVWMSDKALLTVLKNTGNKLMIWSREGPYGRDGWYRLRIPIKASKEPIQLLLKGTVPSNNFITVSNTKLVNNDGNEIDCDVNTVNFFKSHFNNTERLTAYQQLHTNQVKLKDFFGKPVNSDVNSIKPTTMISKGRDSEITHAFTNSIIQTQNFYSETSFTAPMISPNHTLSADFKIEQIQKSLLTNDKIDFSKNQSAPSFEIINSSTIQQQQHMPTSTLPLLSFPQHSSVDQKSITFTRSLTNKFYTERPIINHYMRPNTPAKQRMMKELNALLSQIGGQSVLGMQQLRQLAERFGFNQIDAEQSLQLLKNVMNSKKLQSKITDLSVGDENKKPEPIRPINAPSHLIPVNALAAQLFPYNGQLNSLFSLLPNELRKKFVGESKGLFGQQFNDETVKRLDSVLPFLHPKH